MNDFFRAGLADLAAQVEPVDLYPRVIVASRRRVRQRTAAALVAVAVLSVGTVATTMLYAGRSTTPVVTPSAPATASRTAVRPLLPQPGPRLRSTSATPRSRCRSWCCARRVGGPSSTASNRTLLITG